MTNAQPPMTNGASAAAQTSSRRRRWVWKPFALQFYRLAILVAVVWLVREHHVRVRIQGDLPITIVEVSEFFPEAARLRADHSERMGLFVAGLKHEPLGYVVRTAPVSDSIPGYAGPTDTLIAFDNDWQVVGIRVRRSEDTRTHLEDVESDRYFMNLWKEMDWEQLAELDLKAAGIEGVAGSTMTSMAMAEGITRRINQANAGMLARPTLRVRARDVGLALVVVAALVLTFTHWRGRKWVRRAFQLLVIIYVGFINGDLIAQSLLAGWAKSGVPWHLAPGLMLLVAAALIVPWAARRPIYCLHICPHGAAQEWLGRISPARWRLKLPREVARGLRWLPALLLVLVLLASMLALPVDLADIEPFDAYLLGAAGWATITIAVVGLIASLFVPQAYCRYGCPTGALLEFIRARGPADRFGRRDVAAGLMLLLVLLLYWKYAPVQTWLLGTV